MCSVIRVFCPFTHLFLYQTASKMSDASAATEPKFLIHQATHMFLTDPIHFQVVQMNKSAFIWVGKAEGKLGDMSVAVPPFGAHVT